MTLSLCDTVNRSSKEMRPMEDSPLDHIHIDNERSSFLHGSEADPEDFEDLPPPPMIDSRGDPYLDYPDENRTATPPPSPGLSPFNPPRATTPENGKSLQPVACKCYILKTLELLSIHQYRLSRNVGRSSYHSCGLSFAHFLLKTALCVFVVNEFEVSTQTRSII